MKIYKTLTPSPLALSVALGYFDGVHKGHKKVISKAVDLESKKCTSAIFTFNKSPKAALFNTNENRIMNNEEKYKIFQQLGVKVLYAIDFEEVCNLSPEEFVKSVLSEKLNAKFAICGFNYHFGKGGLADASVLKDLCDKYQIKTKIIKPLLYKQKPISSTRIREAILRKKDDEARKMMS